MFEDRSCYGVAAADSAIQMLHGCGLRAHLNRKGEVAAVVGGGGAARASHPSIGKIIIAAVS